MAEYVIHASGRRKTPCTTAVLAHFGVPAEKFHYAENPKTVKAILRRNGWSVRSRASALGMSKGGTIGKLRKALRKHSGRASDHFYVGVWGHAMVLDGTGKTIVDTAPKKRDARYVVHVSLVEREPGYRAISKYMRRLERDRWAS